ncbi:phenylalanine--tRNA ligase subunit beta [Candidatus Peregrinibacteria bacterium]|nr:phenylalanine--tRNA ligase subunit beta [Candidatus Peregrinibacteria bacterium]
MKISINWLKNYVNIPDNTDINQLAELFTTRTAEVEEVIDLASTFDKMVVGKIEAIEPHPNADKLQITQTNVGGEILKIVCGAQNIYIGQKVAVAKNGAKVKWHGEGELVELKPTKIRGEESNGMICAASEIGLKDEEDGIMDLSNLEAEPGTSLAEALQKNDQIIDIDNKSLTHRPDLWGHYGIAREVAAITGQSLKPIELHHEYPSTETIIPVEIKAKDHCKRYLSTTIENIQVGPSPEWLKNALENTGNRSINNIVDATNFVMLELGNPLHAFDTNKIKEKIIIRTAEKGEKIETLKEGEKELDSDMLIIADKEKPLAIAGIMGGLNSGINNETTSITLEAANFDPISTRKTSVKLGIRTESVQRFEKDLDPLLAEQAFDRLVKIILDLCPSAKIVSAKNDQKNFDYQIKTVKLDLNKVRSKIGVQIESMEIEEKLKNLEFKVKKLDTHHLEVEVPSFRATKDINHQDDLIEEIARLYGYEKIPTRIPELSLTLPKPNTERLEKYSIRNILSLECGYNETLNYSFYSKKTLQNAGLEASKHLKIKNFLSEEQTHLRTTLLPNLLITAANNLKVEDGFKLFEIGRTFIYQNEYFPLEEKHLAGLLVLPKKSKMEPFYEVRDDISRLLERLRITSLKYKRAEKACSMAHPNKHAAFFDFKTQQEIVQIYELHPLIAKNFDLEKNRIACFEINYSLLHKLNRADQKYKAISKYPAVEFDISAILNNNIEYQTLESQIKNIDKNLVKSVQLFDYYKGPNINEGKISMAFKIKLQSNDRTLTDQEIKEIQQNAFQVLQKLGGEIRGL